MIGAFAMSGPGLAAIAGLVVFLIITELLARTLDRGLRRWSVQAAGGGLLAGRLGHVALHWPDFRADPRSILFLWQGGFSMTAAGLAVAAISLWHLWKMPRQGAHMALALALAVAAANLAFFITTRTGGTAGARAASGPPAINPLAFQIDPDPDRLSGQALPTLSGGMLDIAERQGRPLVVNLWATWCPPCRRELPMMAEVAAGLRDVDMVFANQGDAPPVIERYLARAGLSLDPVIIDVDRRLHEQYGALGLPTTLFIGADGTLVNVHVGEISESQLTAEIARLKEGQ